MSDDFGSADDRKDAIKARCEQVRAHVENVVDDGTTIVMELEGNTDAISSIAGDMYPADVYIHDKTSAEKGVIVLRREG